MIFDIFYFRSILRSRRDPAQIFGLCVILICIRPHSNAQDDINVKYHVLTRLNSKKGLPDQKYVRFLIQNNRFTFILGKSSVKSIVSL